MLASHAEHIIRRAAAAERAYWQLVAGASDDPRYKLALIDRRIAVDRELRGEPKPQLAPLNFAAAPLELLVDRELEEIRPAVTARISFRRAAQRLARRCGPVQLELSYMARTRQKLRQLLEGSRLNIREFADAIGVDDSTIERHLNGERPNRLRAQWYNRIREVYVDAQGVHLVMDPPARIRQHLRDVAKTRERALAKKRG